MLTYGLNRNFGKELDFEMKLILDNPDNFFFHIKPPSLIESLYHDFIYERMCVANLLLGIQ